MNDEIRTCSTALERPGRCCFSICPEYATKAVLTAQHDHLVEHARCEAHADKALPGVVATKPLVWDPLWGPEPISDRAADAILGLVDTDRHLREPVEDLQRWERRVPGSDVAIEAITVATGDGDGTARLPESVLAQLLVEAGWERTA